MMRVIIGVAALALLCGVLVTPATAGHLSIHIYSPYTNSNWYYTQGEHDPKRLASARDVSWPSTPPSIVFNATSGVTGEVITVDNNCNQSQTWDKYVTIALWNGGEYYGEVSYVHITNPTVSLGQLISPGTSLGSPQTQSSNCWLGVHIHMERSSNGAWLSEDTCFTPSQCAYTTPVIRMTHSTIQRPEPLSGTRTK